MQELALSLALKGRFARDAVTLMFGALIAQIVPLAIMPILTRVYTPEDFGVFSLFVAVVTILGGFSSLRYELALMLPRREFEAKNIAFLGFCLVLLFSILICLVIILLNLFDGSVLAGMGGAEYLIPFAVFFIGINSLLSYLCNRFGLFSVLSKTNAAKSISAAVLQVVLGFAKGGAFGLVMGYAASQLVGLVGLLRAYLRGGKFSSNISLPIIIKLAARYKGFPLYSVWAGVIFNLNIFLPVILLSASGYTAAAGLYAFSQKILGAPSALISTSLNQVMHKEMVRAKREGAIGPLVVGYVKRMIILSVGPATAIAVVGYHSMAHVFGQAWDGASIFILVLAPLFALKFIFSPMGTLISVMEWQKHGLFYQVASIVVSFFTICAGLVWGSIYAVAGYAVGQVLIIMAYRFYLLKKIGGVVSFLIVELIFQTAVFVAVAGAFGVFWSQGEYLYMALCVLGFFLLYGLQVYRCFGVETFQ